jgi:putative transposase
VHKQSTDYTRTCWPCGLNTLVPGLRQAQPDLLHLRLPARSPDLNAFAERFVRSIKGECLDRFVFFGENMLRHAVKEFCSHYLAERPHQGIGNRLIDPAPNAGLAVGKTVCHERLGGLLKYYNRKAA